MGSVIETFRRHGFAACLCAAALVSFAGVTSAQHNRGAPPAPPQEPNVLERIEGWLERQFGNVGGNFQGAGREVQNFGVEAGIAARTTVEGARGAAEAVSRIPNTRVVRGHSKCRMAPNGAPDCVAAANALCSEQGFGGGKSVDMTTAEVCPPKVYMSGRNTGPGCTTETFVSRALCQ